MIRRLVLIGLLVAAVAYLASCGGSAGSSATAPAARVSALTITTNAILPGAVQGRAYTATLNAINGQGPLHWSIAPVAGASGASLNGLSIDPNTGVLSGTVNFAGTAGFVAQVTDSASPSQTASKNFTFSAFSALSANPHGTAALFQFDSATVATGLGVQGGVPPLNFSATGALPRSMRLNPATGLITGAPLDVGTFAFVLVVQDSFSPAEVINQPFTIIVKPHGLVVAPSLPRQMALNRLFTGKVIATGGIPPYSFAAGSGTLPPGITPVDPVTGAIAGTPTTSGTYFFNVNVKDSDSPPTTTSGGFVVTVAPPLGRNDTPARATPITNGAANASISPYIDPPNGAPLPGDTDFYKIVSLGGATVHVQAVAKQNFPNNPLDTVIQITDGNGRQLATCRQPGDTSTAFTSPCVNDDISSTPPLQDSALDFQVPGATNVATPFYVQVLDWRGDARPDMGYTLQVIGVMDPMAITTSALLPAANGLSYNQQLATSNGTGPISWSLAGGAPPPGLTLSAGGAITGSATANGTFAFTVRATDSASPPQTATAPESILVGTPVSITTSPILPDACLNQPYTFTVLIAGGVPPLFWGGVGLTPFPTINFNQGVFSGTGNVIGTFSMLINVTDATGHGVSQTVSLTVKQCP